MAKGGGKEGSGAKGGGKGGTPNDSSGGFSCPKLNGKGIRR